MRVAVIAGSIAAGMRLAREIERVAGVELFVVVCDPAKRQPALRWLRELVLLVKSRKHWTPPRLWRYARRRRLVVLGEGLNHPSSTERLRALGCDAGLHAANVIYSEKTIGAFRLGILNAHIGILPEYRGRSVTEWSVLQGDTTGVTVFFIGSGIDTGKRIVLRECISPNGSRSVAELKKALFECDARLYRRATEALMAPGFRFECNEVAKGRRYYVMSGMLTNVVDGMLANGSHERRSRFEPRLAETSDKPQGSGAPQTPSVRLPVSPLRRLPRPMTPLALTLTAELRPEPATKVLLFTQELMA